jgi:hypothetical protein
MKLSKTRAPLSEASPPAQLVQRPDTQTSRSQRISARSPKRTLAETRQTIIRHVQAVINVKQEEDDVLDSDPKQEEIEEGDQRTGTRISSRKRRKVVPPDDNDYDEYECGHGSPVNDKPDNDDTGEENVTGDGSDDDELMLGAEVCLRIAVIFIVLTLVPCRTTITKYMAHGVSRP